MNGAGTGARPRRPGYGGAVAVATLVVALVVVAGVSLPAGVTADQASQPSAPAAGQLDSGGTHTCALSGPDLRCWGRGFLGQLGYGNKNDIGDDEAPGAAGPVDLGPGRTAKAVTAGDVHTCALLDDNSVRCWGFGANGRLGYGNTTDIGDNETPGSVGPVDLGAGRTARAISAGRAHTCAVLDNGNVLCWGFANDGRLGYAMPNQAGRQEDVGDDEPPGSILPVDLGPGRTATAISAGDQHTCALLDGGDVRCWGTTGSLFGGDGRLGYPPEPDPPEPAPTLLTVGDDETPGSVGPVNLGMGRTATAISAGELHTCAVLDNGSVRCWGFGADGRLGYGNGQRIGDNETPGSVGPVNLGEGRTATAISAGGHTCARLDNGTVRCWGNGLSGRLGYANTSNIGDDELPSTVGPVDLGSGRTATAVSAGFSHTCARLDDAAVRCWGEALDGRLGNGDETDIGDTEAPGAAGPVDVSPRVSIADASVAEGNGGESTLPLTVTLSSPSGAPKSVAYATGNSTAFAPADYVARAGTVTFAPGDVTETVAVRVRGDTVDEPDERLLVNLSNPVGVTILDPQGIGRIRDDDSPVRPTYPKPDTGGAPAAAAEAARRRSLRACLRRADRHARRELARARRLTGSRRARARRHARRHRSRLRGACVDRWGRTPGRVTGLEARAVSATAVELSFSAVGTDGGRPPPARAYLVKQSRRPIRSARGFRRADSLCGGSCRFSTITTVGGTITLRVTDLRPGTTYYYAVAARDNVSRRTGPRSSTVRTRTP